MTDETNLKPASAEAIKEFKELSEIIINKVTQRALENPFFNNNNLSEMEHKMKTGMGFTMKIFTKHSL